MKNKIQRSKIEYAKGEQRNLPDSFYKWIETMKNDENLEENIEEYYKQLEQIIQDIKNKKV